MFTSHQTGSTDPKKFGFHHKRKEVQICSSSGFRMVRNSMESSKPHSTSFTGESKHIPRKPKDTLVISQTFTKRAVMKLQGQANWIGQCDPVVKLIMSTTRTILKLFKKFHPDSVIRIPKNLKIRLARWISNSIVPQRLGSPIPTFTIQTDATLEGWGFLVNETCFLGHFGPSMKYSINILDLLTIWFALLTI